MDHLADSIEVTNDENTQIIRDPDIRNDNNLDFAPVDRYVTSDLHYATCYESSDASKSAVDVQLKDRYLSLFLSRLRFVMPSVNSTSKIEDHGGEDKDRGNETDDDDEDYRPKRRRIVNVSKSSSTRINTMITLYHETESSIPEVGFQLWKASLLLADYIIAKSATFCDKVVVELGCGVGLLGIVFAMVQTKVMQFQVIMTDYLPDILRIARKNYSANVHIYPQYQCLSRSSEVGRESDIDALVSELGMNISWRVLNWLEFDIGREIPCREASCQETISNLSSEHYLEKSIDHVEHKYPSWSDSDYSIAASKEVVILGADIIYDDRLTLGFMKVCRNLLCRQPKIVIGTVSGSIRWQLNRFRGYALIALEKRFNFELESMSVAAHGYVTFLQQINAAEFSTVACVEGPMPIAVEDIDRLFESLDRLTKFSIGITEGSSSEHERYVFCVGRRVNMLIPQSCMEYNRTPDLELWRVELFEFVAH